MSKQRRERVLTIPLQDGEVVLLSATFPMTPDQWGLMLHILDTMRPALVCAAAEQPPTTSEPAGQ